MRTMTEIKLSALKLFIVNLSAMKLSAYKLSALNFVWPDKVPKPVRVPSAPRQPRQPRQPHQPRPPKNPSHKNLVPFSLLEPYVPRLLKRYVPILFIDNLANQN